MGMRADEEFCSMLKQTGYFDDLELRILRALVVLRQKKQTRVTAAAVAKEAGMPVTNAYKYLYSLQMKGMVESNKDKNKMFWLSQSSNPFPRLLGAAAQEFADKKDLLVKAAGEWAKSVPTNNQVWAGEKIYDSYDNNFVNRAAFLFDVARSEILVTSPRFFKEVVLLDTLSRAVRRGVKIRFLAEEVDSKATARIRETGIGLRFGRAWPYTILVDDVHGMTMESDGKGIWFLNQADHKIKQHFEQVWEHAQEL
jgi:sugar-specific transcriptional regulator TrmB